MIRLHPIPDAEHTCPHCRTPLQIKGWYIPGMRNLADMVCPKCERSYYGDLPAGHGLYYPMLLEQGSGVAHDIYGVPWFADWLRRSYAQRSDRQIPFHVESRKPVKRAILLNCLDTLYGHCLLKLLNAQYYLDHKPEWDLIVLVPRLLRCMVPEGVAEIWTVDLPLGTGTEWNDWLANELRKHIEAMDECWLSVAFSHPHPEDFNIERFTRVRPFPIDEWQIRLQHPTVTFIWRDDRLWDFDQQGLVSRLYNRIEVIAGKHTNRVERQRNRVIKLAETLRLEFKELDFAIVGTDKSGEFPTWITDLRKTTPDDSTERNWCERYASSHVVMGVHGSNMLLPSAHAGAVVELMPNERWGNILQDILFRPDDLRETVFRCRIVPVDAPVKDVALIVTSMLTDHRYFLINMRSEFCDHDRTKHTSAWVTARQQGLARLP